jgi:hypothetical protein
MALAKLAPGTTEAGWIEVSTARCPGWSQAPRRAELYTAFAQLVHPNPCTKQRHFERGSTANFVNAPCLPKDFTAPKTYLYKMAAESYLLVLTNGTHVIDAENAALLNEASDDGKPSVEITIDLHGDGVSLSTARIFVCHVVMLIEQYDRPSDDSHLLAILSGKVHRLHATSRG